MDSRGLRESHRVPIRGARPCPADRAPRLQTAECNRRGRTRPASVTESSLPSLRSRVQAPSQDALLRVQAIFRLVEYDRLRTVDNLIGDFLTAMRGQTMHKQCARL